MPLQGNGILVTSMNVAPDHDEEFNDWYDREHLEERVRIPGFLNARRYQSRDAKRRYFATYTTENFETLTGPAYKAALANQTPWSLTNIDRQVDPLRILGRVEMCAGAGRGAALGVVRIDFNAMSQDMLRTEVADLLQTLVRTRHILGASLVVPDSQLSIPIANGKPDDPDHSQWLILVESSSESVLQALLRSPSFAAAHYTRKDQYALLWDLGKDELN